MLDINFLARSEELLKFGSDDFHKAKASWFIYNVALIWKAWSLERC